MHKDELNKQQVIMMAAGLGRRVGEITSILPKSLIPINGKPMIERNIDCIVEAGFGRLIMVVGYKKELFSYLVDKYSDKIEIIQIENPYYREFNTFSTIYCASEYFDRDSFFVPADIFLVENIYKKYAWHPAEINPYGFYLHKLVKDLPKPDWMATLASDEIGKYIVSVDKNGTSGSMYSGISFWPVEELAFIRSILLAADWDDPSLKTKYWDDLMFPEFQRHHFHVRHMDSDLEVLEVDDEADLIEMKRLVNDPVSVEELKRSLGLEK